MAHKNSTFSRRRFLATAAQAGAALAAPLFIPGAALGKDGSGGRQRADHLGRHRHRRPRQHELSCFFEEPVVQFVAIADIRKDHREPVKQRWPRRNTAPGVATYRDFREMLPRQDIDAVLIATGDRWHTMASICAAKAGKDIYCEKPCSMSIAESQALADTMRRYGHIYQAGTQRRSIANFLFAADLCHSGKLGKLTAVHANTLHPGTGHDWLPGQPLPPKDEVDWDLWLGPTPWRPYNKAYIDGGWRNHCDFHGGGILEWGAHTVDLCNWAGTNDERLPVLYEPTGINATIPVYVERNERRRLRRHLRRRLEARDAVHRLDGPRHVHAPATRARTAGSKRATAAGWSSPPASSAAEQKQFTEAGTSAVSHVKNFLESVKTRKPAHSNAEVVATQPHHLPCGLHRLAAWPAVESSTRSRWSSSATSRPTACGPARLAPPGGSESAGKD